MTPGALFAGMVLGLGALKIIVALLSLILGVVPLELPGSRMQPPPTGMSAVFILAFAGAGAILIIGGRRTSPAFALGTAFVLVASSFSNRLLLGAAASADAAWLLVLAGMNVDAWLPCFLWLFARSFPESRPRDSFTSLFRTAIAVTAAGGLLLFLANSALTFEAVWHVRIPAVSAIGDAFRSSSPETLAPGMLILSRPVYYPLLLVASLAIIPVVVASRGTSTTDRRRILLFMTVLGCACAISVVDLVLAQVSATVVPRWVSGLMLPLLVTTAILLVPFATAYLVLVHRIIGLRLVLRRALQYALARYSLLALGTLPYLIAGVYLYSRRDMTLRDLFSGSSLVVLLLSAAGAMLALGYRHRLLGALDRRFFREQYDARRTLGGLVERSRTLRTVQELGAAFIGEIDRALHISSAEFLFCPRGSDQLINTNGTGLPLPKGSTLVVLLAASNDPLECSLDAADSPLQRLPQAERDWLQSVGCRLLVPLLSSNGALLGALALGSRRSELPYRSEDRKLLGEVAAAAALALERLDHEIYSPAKTVSTSDQRAAPDGPALECLRCGLIGEPGNAACRSCAGTLIEAEVPYFLRDTFKFVRRVGQGGTGIVYLALDVVLHRPVAIKTLPRISIEGADRLRREARLTARVTHRNLALILGAEVWRGRPMLVFEYLERGTLAERLRQVGPMEVADALALTMAIAGALRSVHDAGLVHGDVKPSNIGFNGDDVPKLLDFGVASLISASRAAASVSITDDATHTSSEDRLFSSIGSSLVGTPAYLPPEAFDNPRPAPGFDLWAIMLVLYEALTGRNPFQGQSPIGTVLLVRESDVPPVTEYRPDCPAPIALLLARALQSRSEHRYSSAFALETALSACADAVGIRCN